MNKPSGDSVKDSEVIITCPNDLERNVLWKTSVQMEEVCKLLLGLWLNVCLYLYTLFQVERSTVSACGFTAIEVNINDNKMLVKIIFACKTKTKFPPPKASGLNPIQDSGNKCPNNKCYSMKESSSPSRLYQMGKKY